MVGAIAVAGNDLSYNTFFTYEATCYASLSYKSLNFKQTTTDQNILKSRCTWIDHAMFNRLVTILSLGLNVIEIDPDSLKGGSHHVYFLFKRRCYVTMMSLYCSPSGDALKTQVGSELVVYRSSFCLHQRGGTKK